jgi:hypothetical protein
MKLEEQWLCVEYVAAIIFFCFDYGLVLLLLPAGVYYGDVSNQNKFPSLPVEDIIEIFGCSIDELK